MANGYYSTGTVSITSGAAALVGVGTAWASTIQVGDKFTRNGYSIPVSVVTDNTHITLAWNYPGTTLSGATYMIEYLPDLSRTIDLLSILTSLLGTGGNLTALGGLSGAADMVGYFTGSGAMALTGLSGQARQLLDDADDAAMLTTLGISTFIQTLLDDASQTTALGTLGVSWGAYTPTHTLNTNLDGSTATSTYWVRVGDRVIVAGTFNGDATALGACDLGVSLPVASNLTGTNQLGGVGTFTGGAAVRILGDATNDRATFAWTATSTSNQLASFIFSYGVL
jgi:hypothetical protein